MSAKPKTIQGVQPILMIGAAWGLLASILVLVITGPEDAPGQLGWLALFWGFSVLDLLLVERVVSSLVRFVTASAKQRGSAKLEASMWVLLKITVLFGFVAMLPKMTQAPVLPVGLGLGSLALVPVLAGFLWKSKLKGRRRR